MDNQHARIVGRLVTLPDGSVTQSQRTDTRQRARPGQVVTLLLHPTGASSSVELYDVCVNGLSFLSATPLAVGTVVALHRRAIQPDESWSRSGHVEHCTPSAGGHVVGVVVAPHFTEAELAVLV